MFRTIILFCLCLGFACSAASATSTSSVDSLLNQLDELIAKRETYIEAKEERLRDLHKALDSAATPAERFDRLGALYTEYHSFNADSAYNISLRQEALARRQGNDAWLLNARLNRANIMRVTGMHYETLALIDSINPDDIPPYLKAYYFHTLRSVYGNLTEFAAFEPERKQYEALTDRFRDSLLVYNDPQSVFYYLIKADRLNFHGNPRGALELMDGYIASNRLPEHDRAIFAWTRAVAYGMMGRREEQKEQLLISAIADMKSAVREHLSLHQLALMLYEDGDLDRAQRYLTLAVDDAARGNARQRIVELNDSYPKVNGIYVSTIRSQKRTLEWAVALITVLTLVLIAMLFYLRRQMRKIAEGRRNVEAVNGKLNEANARLTDSNRRLSELNEQLKLSNAGLHEANCAIAEISEQKEVYIGRYMDQSMSYIEMLDSYRKNIAKLLNAGRFDELRSMVRSTSMIDAELRNFYDCFDRTFLNLFPTFVDEFNALLKPESAIIPKKAGTLTPELRIFALIRLGITDSDRIAGFLRYTLTTIYNYRTKVRNRARGDRSKLEEAVMKIGRQSASKV